MYYLNKPSVIYKCIYIVCNRGSFEVAENNKVTYQNYSEKKTCINLKLSVIFLLTSIENSTHKSISINCMYFYRTFNFELVLFY